MKKEFEEFDPKESNFAARAWPATQSEKSDGRNLATDAHSAGLARNPRIINRRGRRGSLREEEGYGPCIFEIVT